MTEKTIYAITFTIAICVIVLVIKFADAIDGVVV